MVPSHDPSESTASMGGCSDLLEPHKRCKQHLLLLVGAGDLYQEEKCGGSQRPEGANDLFSQGVSRKFTHPDKLLPNRLNIEVLSITCLYMLRASRWTKTGVKSTAIKTFWWTAPTPGQECVTSWRTALCGHGILGFPHTPRNAVSSHFLLHLPGLNNLTT
ncbi:hypothetical protein RRG08_017470 [Elysia crispata]|uniref:Uncharacterized protein n=1 Tax=Elysia crispata TaxID=231223 RepID=A0AAE0YHS8_9GAST|nr:hypothetical protein RRG08_017470 [Elysia crispata]